MYKTKFNLFIKWQFIAAALILNSCSSEVFKSGEMPVVDKSFLTGEVCDPPCWYGLVIDISTREDVLSTLNRLPFVDSRSYKEYEIYWFDNTLTNEIQYKCLAGKATPCGVVTFYKDKLKRNWLAVNYDLTLENVIERLGTPDFLKYFWPNPSGFCDISVLWLKKGITVSFQDNKNYNECESVIDGNGVSSDILVTEILYASQDVFEATSNLPGGCCEPVVWPGFKDE